MVPAGCVHDQYAGWKCQIIAGTDRMLSFEDRLLLFPIC